jgi:hypothetical protein
MSVDIKLSPKFETGVPRQLFHVNIKDSSLPSFGVTMDGQRFLVITQIQNNKPAPMTIVLNWTADLKK